MLGSMYTFSAAHGAEMLPVLLGIEVYITHNGAEAVEDLHTNNCIQYTDRSTQFASLDEVLPLPKWPRDSLPRNTEDFFKLIGNVLK